MVKINTQTENDIYLLEVQGEIDATSSIHLDNALKKGMKENQKIMIDLTQLQYISSAGLGVFVSHLEEAKNKNIRWVLFGLSESMYHVFELLGLPQLLKIVENKKEAINFFN